MTSIALRRYRGDTAPKNITVTAEDGCQLNIRVLREPVIEAAIPLVFVHALAMDGDMWQGVADALARTPGARDGGMYALDCRGHGASESSDSDFTTSRFARDLADVMDALGASRAHIVGCSMGGTVALAFAGQYSSRAASLTVIDTTAWYGPEAPANWEKRAQAAVANGMGSLVDFQLARWFSPAYLKQQPDLVRESVGVFTANRVLAYASTCRMLGHADERMALANYTGPVAVVVGEDDYATPLTMAEDVASRLVNSKLTVIPGTRHYTPLEAPQAIAACINEAIDRFETGIVKA